jgi:hypothetical protein
MIKQCTKCKETKEVSEFHRDKSRKDGLRNICKVCVVSYMGKYYIENKELVIRKSARWVAANRKRHNEKCNRWAKHNRAKVNARTARRYASKTKATPGWVTNDSDMLWLITEAYDLARLRTEVTGKKWEVDHIIPLRGKDVCGLHTPFNLRVILQSENRRKSNSLGT